MDCCDRVGGYVADKGGEFLFALFLLFLADELALLEETFLAVFGVLLLLFFLQLSLFLDLFQGL